MCCLFFFFFSSRRRHTRYWRDWSSDVCSSDLVDRASAPEHDDVARFYRELDGFLGRLRARLQPGTVLAVVSDHGHSPTIFHSMDTQHRHGPPGILLLHGGPVRAGSLPASAGVLDVYPTLLYL